MPGMDAARSGAGLQSASGAGLQGADGAARRNAAGAGQHSAASQGQNSAEGAIQHSAGLHSAGLHSAGQDSAGQHSAGQHSAGQDSGEGTGHHSARQDNGYAGQRGASEVSRDTELRRQEAASAKVLYTVDARTTADSPVTDVSGLTALATASVAAGGGHVLHSSHVIFPNGAITLVLVLAESHLSIHTWPEESLVAVDLFSCGSIDGRAVLDGLTGGLRLEQVTIREIPRGLPPGQPMPPTA